MKEMEKHLNSKLENYILSFKDGINEKVLQLGIENDPKVKHLLQYVYDYNRLSFAKEDFQKRKRIKNYIPSFDRCCAKRASNEQCTRKKKDNCNYCGTHIKGTPYGIVDNVEENKTSTQKIEVWTQDIQGIIYYIDNKNNVYNPEDIISNKTNPKIIAKYSMVNDGYFIPEFN